MEGLKGNQKKFYKEVRNYIKRGQLGMSALPKGTDDITQLKAALSNLAKKIGAKVYENENEVGIMSSAFYRDIYVQVKAKQN